MSDAPKYGWTTNPGPGARGIDTRDIHRGPLLAEIERLTADLASERTARAEAERWQVEVAEGLGFLNRAEGQGGYEVAAPRVIVEAFRAAESALSASREEAGRLAGDWEAKAATLDKESEVPLRNDDDRRTALAKFVTAIALRDCARAARAALSADDGASRSGEGTR
jgi:hypothetical protein